MDSASPFSDVGRHRKIGRRTPGFSFTNVFSASRRQEIDLQDQFRATLGYIEKQSSQSPSIVKLSSH